MTGTARVAGILRQVGLVFLFGCIGGLAVGQDPALWGRALLVLTAVGMLHGGLLGLGERDPERQIGHLCWIHGAWAVLGAAGFAVASEQVADVVRSALVWQVAAHALLVPGLAAWMDAREDDVRAADETAELATLIVVCTLATVGVVAGLHVVAAAGTVDEAAGRMALIGVVLTIGGYVRILTPPAPRPEPDPPAP